MSAIINTKEQEAIKGATEVRADPIGTEVATKVNMEVEAAIEEAVAEAITHVEAVINKVVEAFKGAPITSPRK